MLSPSYVRYDDSVEVVQPDEEATIGEVLDVFHKLQTLTFEKHRHAVRAAHAKSHGILRGELTVSGGLSRPLAQGLFATPRTYPVIVRLSTAPGDILADGIASFRGMALKVIGVDGPKLLPELADAVTQDFLLVNHPFFPTGDVRSFLSAQRRLETTAHAPEPLQEALTTTSRLAGDAVRAFGAGDPAGLIGQAKPETHILGETYYTTAPLRYGDYIAKLAVVPVSDALQPLVGRHVDTSDAYALRDLVVAFFREQGAECELRAQLCTDLKTMPVEDASVRWPEDAGEHGSPYQPVARLTIPAQEAYSPERRVYADEVLAFSPWHTLPAHRPLGSLMRARRRAYDASARFRHAMNARRASEPRSIDELPA